MDLAGTRWQTLIREITSAIQKIFLFLLEIAPVPPQWLVPLPSSPPHPRAGASIAIWSTSDLVEELTAVVELNCAAAPAAPD